MSEIVSKYIKALTKSIKGYSDGISANLIHLRSRKNVLEQNFNHSFSNVSDWLNKITGYEMCEKLRRNVKDQDDIYLHLRDELQQARQVFNQAIRERSQCQKELNSLLQRKQSWQDTELLRFTELYRNELKLEQAERDAKELNDRLETEIDKAHHKLMVVMRERYQEEQLWSDKIRRISTYGTFGLMLLNVMLFLILQLVLEPRKRKMFIDKIDFLLQKYHLDESLKNLENQKVIENDKPSLLGKETRKYIPSLSEEETRSKNPVYSGMAIGASISTLTSLAILYMLVKCK